MKICEKCGHRNWAPDKNKWRCEQCNDKIKGAGKKTPPEKDPWIRSKKRMMHDEYPWSDLND